MAKRIWVTADTHFGHTEAIGLFARPVAINDVRSMDELLIDRINSRVNRRDHLLHLGDFTGPRIWKGVEGEASMQYANDLRKRIVCETIEVVRGNHDPSRKRLKRFSMTHMKSFLSRDGQAVKSASSVATIPCGPGRESLTERCISMGTRMEHSNRLVAAPMSASIVGSMGQFCLMMSWLESLNSPHPNERTFHHVGRRCKIPKSPALSADQIPYTETR